MAEHLLGKRQAGFAPAAPAPPRIAPPHGVDLLAVQRKALNAHTTRPLQVQRLVAGPVLRATELHAQETARVEEQRQAVERQAEGVVLPEGAVATALQRQAERSVPLAAPTRPSSPADWVTVMRDRAGGVEGRGLTAREHADFLSLQRQVAGQLIQGYRTDRSPERTSTYAEHLVALQRHPISAPVSRAVLGTLPPGERMGLQRAVDQALQREREQQAQDEAALHLHALQRQLAELDAEATQPVFQRIQARRGAGNPLPEAIQRHLEQGLNHDLSRVRIHDDAEADLLAKGVNATAFTTGTDIFFRSGQFNPNTQSGLELLAHEVTHTVQQAQGRVGAGVDPDAGLEAEARTMGARLASGATKVGGKLPAPTLAPRGAGGGFLVQRKVAPGKSAFKIGEVEFWKALPGAMFDGAKQSLVDIWELIRNLPVITRQLPELTRKAVAWLRTMDTVQEWKAVVQSLGMAALTAGENWLKKAAGEQGRSVGFFVGKLIGDMALGKGAGAAVRAVKGGGGIVKMFEDFTRRVNEALARMNRGRGGQPALAMAGDGHVSLPAPNRTAATSHTAGRTGGGLAAVPDPRDLAVQKLLGRVPANFAKVRDLIGRPFDATKLPKADYYTKRVGGTLVIVRKVGDDRRFTPLTIDANGRVQVNVVERLSNPTAMKKNFQTKWGALPKGHWIHHLIPDTLIRNHPVGQALQKLGYDLDRGSNLLNLPGKDVFDANVDLLGHWTDHPKYTKYVQGQLDALKRKYGPLDRLTPQKGQQLLKDMEVLEEDLREKLGNDFFEKRPDGSLAAVPDAEGEVQA